jgi:hypothetical protein
MAATFFQGPLLLHHSKGHYLRPRVAVMLTCCSRLKCTSLMIDTGRRSAGLLPHLRITDFTTYPHHARVYNVDTSRREVRFKMTFNACVERQWRASQVFKSCGDLNANRSSS